MAELGRYTDYKDSEQIWLGEMPTHWKLSRLGARLFERRETNERNEIQHVLSVMKGRGVIPYTEKGNVGNKRSDDIRRYKIVRPDDIVINCMNVIIGSLGISKYTGCLSPVYYVLRTRFDDDVPRYFNSVFQTANFHRSLVRIGNGILAHRMRIPMEKLKCEMIPVPPPDEQVLIVRFMDWAIVRLGKAIAAKRKVIGLLEEQKQAIIHRAVTRGLDDSVPLKPSGLNWLGDVPEHWEVCRLTRYLAKVEQGWSPVAANGDIEENQWAVLGLSAINRGRFNAQAIKPIPQRLEVPKRMEVKDGDILMTRSNTRERVGDIALVKGCRRKTILSDLIYRLTLRSSELNSELFVYQMLSKFGRAQIETSARGSSNTMPKISQSHIKPWIVLVPPMNEQRLIVKSLHEKLSEIDSVDSEIRVEIALLTEYRTRLIADVVTGKLDVREFARTLPPDIAEEAAELASRELGDDEYYETDDELAKELTGEPV